MMEILTYENKLIMQPIIDHLKTQCEEGEKVIYRDCFRWKNQDGHVLSNCYEMFSLEGVAGLCNYEIVHNFHHTAIVKSR